MGCAHRVGPVQMPLSRDQGDSESVSAFVRAERAPAPVGVAGGGWVGG